MRTIIVIFTDHKVPVHEIPNFKKYKFLCNYDFVSQYDMIEDPRYSPQMMIVGFSPDTRRKQKGLILKDIFITKVNGKYINQPYHNSNKEEIIIEESRNIKVSLEQAREWYNSTNLALRTLALNAFKEQELAPKLEYVMNTVIARRQQPPVTREYTEKQQAIAYLRFVAEYFNGTWEKTLENKGYFLAKNLMNDSISVNSIGELKIMQHNAVVVPGIIYFKKAEDVLEAVRILGKEIDKLFKE